MKHANGKTKRQMLKAFDEHYADHGDRKRPPKMKASWKRAWLKALRSGQYAQARGILSKPLPSQALLNAGFDADHHDTPEASRGAEEGFCCLGVLCEAGFYDRRLAGSECILGAMERKSQKGSRRPYFLEWMFRFPETKKPGGRTEVAVASLPARLLNIIGLDTHAESSLIEMNDVLEADFEQIAYIIEKRL